MPVHRKDLPAPQNHLFSTLSVQVSGCICQAFGMTQPKTVTPYLPVSGETLSTIGHWTGEQRSCHRESIPGQQWCSSIFENFKRVIFSCWNSLVFTKMTKMHVDANHMHRSNFRQFCSVLDNNPQPMRTRTREDVHARPTNHCCVHCTSGRFIGHGGMPSVLRWTTANGILCLRSLIQTTARSKPLLGSCYQHSTNSSVNVQSIPWNENNVWYWFKPPKQSSFTVKTIGDGKGAALSAAVVDRNSCGSPSPGFHDNQATFQWQAEFWQDLPLLAWHQIHAPHWCVRVHACVSVPMCVSVRLCACLHIMPVGFSDGVFVCDIQKKEKKNK